MCFYSKYMFYNYDKNDGCVIPEAEYTFRLRKRVVPLRLQPDYYPDGWLGALAGSKLVIDCSLPSKFEESLRNLVKELGNVGKGGGGDFGKCASVFNN